MKKWKKKEECTVDYYCNSQCIGCGWTVNSLHSLVYYLIKNKIEKDNFGENYKKIKTKKTMRRNTIAINNVLKKKIKKIKFSIRSILKK
jgi:hypothetical protein